MARDYSNKRRKLDTSATKIEQAVQDTAEIRTTTQRRNAVRRPVTPTVDDTIEVSKSRKQRVSASGQRATASVELSSRSSPHMPDEDETGDEIIVRSSGRVRQPSAKLQSAEPAVRSEKSNVKARSKASTPVRDRTDVVVNPARSRKSSSKTGTTAGKENVTPPLSKESSAEYLSEEIHVTPSIPQTLTVTTSLKRKRPVRTPSKLPVEIAESDVEGPAVVDVPVPDTLDAIQYEVMSRLTGRKPARLVDLDDEFQKVNDVVKHTVDHGESNSLLMIGSRGSGKSALLNSVLAAQTSEFHTVRLNGFIHTDDKLALRETCRQLGQADAQSYADNLTVLLALLSQIDQKSVVFVLDEFDLFATHPRQTLLYNLFDIAQSKKAPIAVIGLTTRVDIVEALEKRVKSRFSHRYVHLGFPKSLTAFTDICKTILTADLGASPIASSWSDAMQSLLDNDLLARHIRKIYYRTKSIADFKAKMMIPLATLAVDSELSPNNIVEHFLNMLPSSVSQGPDSKLDLLVSLSTLQLALLICAARQYAIYSTENVSFNLVHEEYKTITGKSKLQASATGTVGRAWSKETAKGAWEDLIDIELIMEDGRGCKVDIALQEIADSGVDLGQWAKWCKEI